MMSFGPEHIGGSVVVLLLLIALYLVISTKKIKKIKHFLRLSLLISGIFCIWYFQGFFVDTTPEIETVINEYTHGSAEMIIDQEEEIIPPEILKPVGIDISTIKSASAEKEGVTMCSKTARITLRSLTSKSYEMNHGDNIVQGDAISLIESGIESGVLEEISFSDGGVNPSKRLFEMLAYNEYDIADIYLYRNDPDHGKITRESAGNDGTLYAKYLEQAHRFVVVLGDDGILYALDPYRGGTGTSPQRFVDYVGLIPDRTMYVGATYNAEIDESVLTYYESSHTTYKAIQPQQKVLPTIEEVQGGVAGYLQVKNPQVRIEDIVNNSGVEEEKREVVEEVGSLLGL